MTEDTISQLLIQVPNLAIAVWSLWWSFRRVEQMLALHERLIERLVAQLSPDETQEVRKLIASSKN